MACPKCKDYMGRCGECGADLNKATHSAPIGRAPFPRAHPQRPVSLEDLREFVGDKPKEKP